MRYFESFAGVGGIGLGLPKEWECVGVSEIDKYASQVLKYHYPKVKNYGDIKSINWNEVPDFDLLTGGSPCQDFSIAGKRRGLEGSKSSLAWEFIRALRDKQPRHFIWENVKGVLSSRGGWDFANLISAFSESGYSLWWQVLNAKDFGVPQNRERIFVVGFRDGSPKEVFFERETGRNGDETARDELREQVANTLRTNYSNGKSNETYIQQLNQPEHSNYRVYDAKGISPALNTMQGGLQQPKVVIPVLTPNRAVKRQNGRRMKTDGEPSFTLNTQDQQGIYNGDSIRRLTPVECERLMSWSDNHTKFGSEGEISDSQRYKMCGNGVVSSVIKEISRQLF